MWLKRVTQLVHHAKRPLLVGARHYEVSVVARSLLELDGRVMWIELDAGGPAVMSKLNWGLGNRLNLSSLLEAVKFHGELIHRSQRPTIFITNVEYSLEDVIELLRQSDSLRHRIVASGSISAIDTIAAQVENCRYVTSQDFDMTSQEVTTYFYDNGFEVAEPWDESNPRTFGRVRELVLKRLGLAMEQAPCPLGLNGVKTSFSPTPATVVEVLIRNRQWSKALDVTIATGDNQHLAEVLDVAGGDAIHMGQLAAFRRKLNELPEQMAGTDVALYWKLVTEISLRLSTGLVEDIRQRLDWEDLPRVKVFWRVAGLDRASLPDALESSNHHDLASEIYIAHLKALNGNPDQAVRELRRIVERIDSADQPYRVVQAMLLLTNSLILNGSYLSALYWGEATHAKALELNADSLEESVASALTAYARMLAASFDVAGEKLSTLQVEEYLGMPYAESIVTTMADYFALANQFGEAINWYELAVQDAPAQVRDIVIPDIALSMVRLGQSFEAESRFRAEYEVSGDFARSSQWAEFAFIISQIETKPDSAIDGFEQLLRRRDSVLTGPYRARASILLAVLLFRKKRLIAALENLNASAPVLRDLGNDGWKLLSGNAPEISEVRRLWQEAFQPVRVQFLGYGHWHYRDHSSEAVGSLRLKELLFVLSRFPQGVSGDKLASLMGMDGKSETTIRMHIARLKRYIPVHSSPYRLAVRVDADYEELERAISENDVARVLDLYNGSLLPDSDAPFIREKRSEFESLARMFVVEKGTPSQVAQLALKLADDLDLAEYALNQLDVGTVLHMQLKIRVQQLRESWLDN